jgi:surface polysaccharide O-acyltransferase-like enzyme
MDTTPLVTAGAGGIAQAKPRLAFIDNLRWVMIVLVVSMHAAVTYSHLGSWYFMEDPKPGPLVLLFFAAYQSFLQAFFMGLLFLIAGYFVPAAFNRKGPGHFLRDRAVRLGIPSLLYMVAIQPVIVHGLLRVFADHARSPLSRAYLPYLVNGRFLGGSGPMWFAVALLGFSLVYGVGRSLARQAPEPNSEAPLPGHAQVLGLGSAIALGTFLARTVQPVGTDILNMQLCFFSQYILLFGVGVCAWRRNWLLRIPYRFGMRWLMWALTAGSVAWLAIILAVAGTHTEAKLTGGWTWQSAAYCLWESFFCTGACLGLIVVFRDKFNSQGKFARWLSDNCFAVYVFHPPVLIAVTLALRGFDTPKLVKFLCATGLAVAGTWLVSSLALRRIPLLKRVL